MSDKPKCSKPGCSAINAIGEACLDRDCPQTWVHYTAYNAEVERLTCELSEARATGRREGIEEAARYHDDLEAQHAAAHANVESDHHMMMERQHRRHAAAIRAAKEKP